MMADLLYSHAMMTERIVAAVTVAAMLLLTGCGSDRQSTPAGPEQRESRSVDLDKSERVRVELKMPVGDLNVRGGAQKLMEADFTYNVPAWKPEVRYRSSGAAADLTIEQPRMSSTSGDTKNRWDLRLNETIPSDFRVELGAGEARLELGRLSLRSVDVTVGAGTLNLDLRGNPSQDYSVHVRGGVGEATVRLPKDVGISASASGGLGDISVTGLHKTGDKYVNDAFDKAERRIRLDIQGGVGSIKLIAE